MLDDMIYKQYSMLDDMIYKQYSMLDDMYPSVRTA